MIAHLHYSRVWEFLTWGLSIGFALGLFFFVLGLWSGIGFRWVERFFSS